MDEITTPLAKEVYKVLDYYNSLSTDMELRSYDDLDRDNKRLALKVQTLEVENKHLRELINKYESDD